MQVRRLDPSDRAKTQQMFKLLTTIFDEPAAPLHDDYVEQLLNRDSFWALAAFADGELVGELTAHSLPMTRAHSSELLTYDIAVRGDRRRNHSSPNSWRHARTRHPQLVELDKTTSRVSYDPFVPHLEVAARRWFM